MNTRSSAQRRNGTWSCRRLGALAVLITVAVVGLAACGGSGSSPQVASLGQSSSSGSGSGGGSSATTSSGNPTQLLDEWAACIRKHGDPNQSDPTIDADKDIEISMTNVPEALENEVHESTGPCSNYLVAASLALSGGQPQPTANPVKDAQFAQCMRANGYPNWPDPTGGDTSFRNTGINPDSPAVQNASSTCDKKVGLPDYGSSGPAGVVQVTDCNGLPPGKQCPSGPPGSHGGGNGGPVPVASPGPGGNGGGGTGGGSNG